MFKFIKNLKSGVRIGELKTPHGKIETPFFMPVGTVGSVKGVLPGELKALGAQIVLSNTYHLYLRPGEKLIKKLGGLHRFMNWDGPVLTDSGGYQVFSLGQDKYQETRNNNQTNSKFQIPNTKKLSNLVKITDEGVEFTSHLDGSKHFFTPEKVIQIQLDLGVDVLMPLDVCPSGKASKEEVMQACVLTADWARRSKEYFDKQISNSKFQTRLPDGQVSNKNSNDQMKNDNPTAPLLFGIVQGGLHDDLRKWCTEEITKIGFDGYAVGGLAVDFETRDMWKTVKLMGELLPEDKPRYLMGVGTLDDIIKATRLGMDMFDCVLPTRLARHGSVYTRCHSELVSESQASKRSRNKFGMTNYKLINLVNSKYKTDGGVIDKNCGCPACSGRHSREGGNPELGQASETGFSRAYISHLLRSKEITGLRLATLHNLHQYLELMRELRRCG